MDRTEVGPKLSRAELRKQKLMEYLASKGRLKPLNPKPYLRNDLERTKKADTRTTRSKDKENQVPNFSAHFHYQTTKTVSKPHAPKQASTYGVFKRAPLVSSQDVTIQTHIRNLKISGSTECFTHAPNTASGIVKQQQSKTQKQPLSSYAGIISNKVQSSHKNKCGSSSQAMCGSLEVNKAPLRTSERPLTGTLHKHAGSQTSQRKVETQKKPQEALKTVRRTDHICANRELAQRSCVTSKPYAVISKAPKTPWQTLNCKNSTISKIVSNKSLDHKTEKRTVRTTVLSQAPSNVSQTQKLRPLKHGSTQIQDKSRLPTLRSGVPKDNQKPTTLSRKPSSSVLSKPTSTAVPRASKVPASSNVPQIKGSAAMVPVDVRQKVTTTAKGSTLGQPPSKSSKPCCRPATAPSATAKTVRRLTTNTGLLLVPEHLKTPVTQNRPLTARPRTELKSSPKKPTAAQEERLRKLQEWREAKGISYKRPPMPIQKSVRRSAIATPQHYWAAMEEEDDLNTLVCAVDRSLADCLQLLQEGCPSEQVVEVLSRVPMAQKFCKYWMCQARLMEREGNYEVLPLFEEAVRLVREPVDDLRAVVFEILKKKETKENSGEGTLINKETMEEQKEALITKDDILFTPKAVGAFIRGVKGGSSVVKYKITATPGQRSQHREPLRVDGQEVRFLTPVRRSVRIERSAPCYPSALQEQDPCVASFRDLLSSSSSSSSFSYIEKSPLYIYRENEALKDQVQVQLFPEES